MTSVKTIQDFLDLLAEAKEAADVSDAAFVDAENKLNLAVKGLYNIPEEDRYDIQEAADEIAQQLGGELGPSYGKELELWMPSTC